MLLPQRACLGVIESTLECHGKRTTTRHDHVSSRLLDATPYPQAARAHWSIENGLHWRLDVVFDKDRARSRKDDAARAMRRKT